MFVSEKKAAAMRKEADAFARAKANEIIRAAEAQAEERLKEGAAESARQTAALTAASRENTAEAVRQTALYLLELS